MKKQPIQIVNPLEKDFDAFIEKHNLTACSFCGTNSDNEFVGIHGPSKTLTELFEITTNVGRLWQHSREEARRILNRFEKPLNGGW